MARPPAAIPSMSIYLAALALVAGCASRTGGGGVDEVAEDDVEPRAYCPEREPGPLMDVAVEIGGIQAGACGDLVYRAGELGFWYRPGLGPVEVDADPWSTRFAPTGHLLAWKKAEADGLVLADTRSGELVELPTASSFGLVPAPGTDHGADLWTCRDHLLALDGPGGPTELAEAVACESVVGSTGSPRVVFADSEGAVFLADLEQLELWPVAGADYSKGTTNEQGFVSDDKLWIDHDGRVVVHEQAVWESDPDSDADWRVTEGLGVYIDGEQVDSWSGAGTPSQAFQVARRGAPVVVRPGTGVRVYSSGVARQLGGGRDLGHQDFDAAGRLVVVDEDSGELLRLSDDHESLELLAEGVVPFELMSSEDGRAVALVELHPDCEADVEACTDGHKTVRLWREDGGFAATPLAPGLWELAALTDAGEVLAIREGVDAEPSEVVLFDAALEPLASWIIEGGVSLRARVVETLADGRIVAEIGYSGGGVVLLADPGAAAGEQLVAVSSNPVEVERVFLDASERALAFVEENADGVDHLIAGATPP